MVTVPMRPATANDGRPDMLALDWGTSSLRAFLMQDGEVLDTRHSPHGIQNLPASGVAGFEQAFALIARDWLSRWPHLPVVASGMVGSAQGWREAPYVSCPADVQKLAALSVRVPTGLGNQLLIAPGLLLDTPGQLPDVMRGEEIQIAGVLRQHPLWAARACIVLPGTHSKWVNIIQGQVLDFASYMTGELFAVLKQHSILGRLMPEATAQNDPPDANAFALGLTTARDSGPGDLSHQLFATRTLGLTGRLPHAHLPDFLSGLLIGHELMSGLAFSKAADTRPLVLIGAPPLCARYQQALDFLGRTGSFTLDNTAPAGLWDLALAAGLLPPKRGP